MTKMAYRITLECGDSSCLKAKKTVEGYTHDWEVFVRGADNAAIHHYIEKVVFNLHNSFPKPRRVIKEPPYCIKQSGYGGFDIPIHIYLKNKNEPKKFEILYSLNLESSGPAVKHMTSHNEVIHNPSDEFRKKLLKGGATPIAISEVPEKSEVKTCANMVSKPKLSGHESRKHKLSEPRPSDPFNDLFGTPITKMPKLENKKTSDTKPSTSKTVVTPEKSEKMDKNTKSKHNLHKDSKKEKSSEEKKEKRDKEREVSKEKEKIKDKSKRSSSPSSIKPNQQSSENKRSSSSPTIKKPPTPPVSKKPSSPIPSSTKSKEVKKSNDVDKDRNKEKEKDRDKDKERDKDKDKEKDKEREKIKESLKNNSEDVKIEKESKSERKKEKKKHKEDRDKEKKEKHKDKDRDKNKDKVEGNKILEKKIEKIDKVEKVEKEREKSLEPKLSKDDRKSPKFIKEEKIKPEKNEKIEKPEKHKESKSEKSEKSRHKHKKREKKEKRDSSRDREKKEKREKSKSINEKLSENSNHCVPVPVSSMRLLDTLIDRDSSDSVASDDEDSHDTRPTPVKKEPVVQALPPPEPLRAMSPPPPPSNYKKDKNDRKHDRSKSNREDKEKKSKKRQNESKGFKDDAPVKKYKQDRDPSSSPLDELVSSSQSPIAANVESSIRSSKSKHASDDQIVQQTSNDTEQVAPDSTNEERWSEEYLSELQELQRRIGLLDNTDEVQRLVDLVEESGQFEITEETFDFDLCALDRRTIQRLQQFFNGS